MKISWIIKKIEFGDTYNNEHPKIELESSFVLGDELHFYKEFSERVFDYFSRPLILGKEQPEEKIEVVKTEPGKFDVNAITGGLMCLNKYRFADKTLIAEVVRDVEKMLRGEKNADIWIQMQKMQNPIWIFSQINKSCGRSKDDLPAAVLYKGSGFYNTDYKKADEIKPPTKEQKQFVQEASATYDKKIKTLSEDWYGTEKNNWWGWDFNKPAEHGKL
jgi:hypothetical protein